NNRIQKYDLNGTLISTWGTPDNGVFTNPSDVAADSAGNVYVADTGHSQIQEFKTDGTALVQWNCWPSPSCTDYFSNPNGVATGSCVVLVSDTLNNRIEVFTPSTSTPTNPPSWSYAWGTLGSGNGQFVNQEGIVVDGVGNVYVVDTGN